MSHLSEFASSPAPRRLSTLLTVMVFAASGCTAPAPSAPERLTGGVENIGAATASAYAEFGADNEPISLGLAFSSNLFGELPSGASDGKRCFDRDGDGTIANPAECNMWHEWAIPLPDAAASRSDIPFKWALLNYNPMGHIPPGVYDVPHFDMHFMIPSMEEVFAIEPGPCGPEFVRCDQFEVASRPLPPNYKAADFVNVGAIAPAMGNHLIDTTAAEMRGVPFTRTWIYGTYDGEVTYYEEMVTSAYLMGRPSECFAIKSPPAVGLAGYYPTESCLRYLPESDEYTVSIEGFVYRDASPPDPLPVAISDGNPTGQGTD